MSNEPEKDIAGNVTSEGRTDRGERERDSRSTRSRSRSRRRDRRSRSRSRDRDRDRSRRDRSRSRSRDRRSHRDRDRSRERSSRDRRSRDRERSREHRDGSRSGRDRSEDRGRERSGRSKSAEKEEEDSDAGSLTRDQRTVFVSDLQIKVDENWLSQYFGQAGPVRKITLIRDHYSHKSKGMGYVEMANLDDATKALMLNGMLMCTKHPACNCSGFPMKVKRSEAEKNWAAVQAKPASKLLPRTRLFFSKVPGGVPENDLRKLFEAYGEIEFIRYENASGDNKTNSGYVDFRRPECASRASKMMNGLEILPNYSIEVTTPQVSSSRYGNTIDDDADSQNVSLDPQSRAMLIKSMTMKRNDAELNALMNRAAGIAGPVGGPAGGVIPKVEGNVSNCVVLHNLFNPSMEHAPDWDITIRDDTRGQCERFGQVLHCVVDKQSPDGRVYLMFDHFKTCSEAAGAMVKLMFNKRQIYATYVSIGEYVNRFPDSRQAASIANAKMANSM